MAINYYPWQSSSVLGKIKKIPSSSSSASSAAIIMTGTANNADADGDVQLDVADSLEVMIIL
jgi:hypothetical protein